jgi:hypothetical protein
MKHVACLLLAALVPVCDAHAQRVTRDIPYAPAHERQVLDVHAPGGRCVWPPASASRRR